MQNEFYEQHCLRSQKVMMSCEHQNKCLYINTDELELIRYDMHKPDKRCICLLRKHLAEGKYWMKVKIC